MQEQEQGQPELAEYTVVLHGVATTMQLTAEHAALIGAKRDGDDDEPSTTAGKATTKSRTAFVANKGQHN